jgi:uncharacterized protein YlzI (FlbEa/FlbD family)
MGWDSIRNPSQKSTALALGIKYIPETTIKAKVGRHLIVMHEINPLIDKSLKSLEIANVEASW